MDKIWKLSPSELTFLWDECPRCFYLKVIRNFSRPWSPFPSIFNRIDKLMKDYFDGRSAMDTTPDGKIAYLGEVTWLEVPRDDEWFFGFLGNVLDVLDQDEPPASSEDCGWCQYRQAARGSDV